MAANRMNRRKSQEQRETEWAAQDAAFFADGGGLEGWGSGGGADGRQPAGSGRHGGNSDRSTTGTGTGIPASTSTSRGSKLSDEELARRLQVQFMNGFDSCSFSSSLFAAHSNSADESVNSNNNNNNRSPTNRSPTRSSLSARLPGQTQQQQHQQQRQSAAVRHRHSLSDSITRRQRQEQKDEELARRMQRGEWDGHASSLSASMRVDDDVDDPNAGFMDDNALDEAIPSGLSQTSPPAGPPHPPPPARGIQREANIRQNHPLRRSINDFRSSSDSSSLLGPWFTGHDNTSPTNHQEEASSRPLLARSLSSRDTSNSQLLDDNTDATNNNANDTFKNDFNHNLQQTLVSDDSWKRLMNRSTAPPSQPLPPTTTNNNNTTNNNTKNQKKGGAASMLRTALGIGASSSNASSSVTSSSSAARKTRSVTPPHKRRGAAVAAHSNSNSTPNSHSHSTHRKARSNSPKNRTQPQQQQQPQPQLQQPSLLAAIANATANNNNSNSNPSSTGGRRLPANLIPAAPAPTPGGRATTVPQPAAGSSQQHSRGRGRGRATSTATDGPGGAGGAGRQNRRIIRGSDELGGSFRATVSGTEVRATPSSDDLGSQSSNAAASRNGGSGGNRNNPFLSNGRSNNTNNSTSTNTNNRHTTNTNTNVCDECHRVATSYLLALGKKYHRHCFRCMGCHEVIDHTQPFTYTEVEGNGGVEKHPLHRQCYSELFGMKCTICNSTIPSQSNGRISYMKHPFFEKEIMCPDHANDETKRCSGCHRFEPSYGNGFADLGDAGRCVCYSCCRTVVVDNADATPLWARVLEFFEKKLNLPVWEGMKQVPILIVGHETLNEQAVHSNHSDSAQIMTRGLCLTEHSRGSRIGLMPRMKFDRWSRSFEKIDEATPTSSKLGSRGSKSTSMKPTREEEVTYFTIPKASEANEKSSVTAILCLSGLPSDLTASILAHEATHAWLKLHPDYVFDRPIPPQVEEGVCQLVAHLFLTDGLEEPSVQPSPDGGPSEERLRQYFKFSIETDVNEVYGDGFRKASRAYSEIGIELLLSHIVLYRNFPEL